MSAIKNKKKDILSEEWVTHALTYIPYFIGPLLMFFLANSDKKKLRVHLKYSWVLALIAILLMIALNYFFTWLLSIAYLGVSILLAYKAYNGDKIQINFIDSLEDSVQEKLKK